MVLYLQAYPSQLDRQKQPHFINQGVGTTKAFPPGCEYPQIMILEHQIILLNIIFKELN
jgi:hypothetical protein